mmetsp:Transcript_20660/g.65094  ORF Transcript_20660/g.65094 Transcript_20660/m.65094 type:complete len:230 (-) Transcript_20660:5-694(-)
MVNTFMKGVHGTWPSPPHTGLGADGSVALRAITRAKSGDSAGASAASVLSAEFSTGAAAASGPVAETRTEERDGPSSMRWGMAGGAARKSVPCESWRGGSSSVPGHGWPGPSRSSAPPWGQACAGTARCWKAALRFWSSSDSAAASLARNAATREVLARVAWMLSAPDHPAWANWAPAAPGAKPRPAAERTCTVSTASKGQGASMDMFGIGVPTGPRKLPKPALFAPLD